MATKQMELMNSILQKTSPEMRQQALKELQEEFSKIDLNVKHPKQVEELKKYRLESIKQMRKGTFNPKKKAKQLLEDFLDYYRQEAGFTLGDFDVNFDNV